MNVSSLPKRVLYYGRDEPQPARISLRAGPLTAIWEEGGLRTICLGRVEVLRRIYVAVRDQNWGTVASELTNVSIQTAEDSFRIRFDAVHRQDEVDFAWRGEIVGLADGAIRFSMDGVARRDFLRNRIGFCVLHAAEAAGAAARVTHADGTVEACVLPEEIVASQPVPPFSAMTALSHEVLPGVWADLGFEGDLFEMEDQRNWTDASFKTYCTPLALPYPVAVRAGERVQQAVTLTLRHEHPSSLSATAPCCEGEAASPRRHRPDGPVLAVHVAAPGIALPRFGLGMASHGEALSPRQLIRLRALHLDHLRADIRLVEAGWPTVLDRAVAAAAALDTSLHLALFVDAADADRQLAALRRALAGVRPAVSYFLLFPTRESFRGAAPIGEIVAAGRRQLADYPGARLASGTNADYIFLARNLPPLDQVDALTFAIHPQEHAFDNASLVETLRTQATVVANARRLAQGRPVLVSPVTLRRRFNPHARGEEPPMPAGALPASVDHRQMSLFGAGWTVGSLKYLAQGGATSITYYETTGWRGVMETPAGSPAPPFQALAGCVFPLYHVLADVAGFSGGELVVVQASVPQAVDGLALRQGNRLRVLAANLTEEHQLVLVRGLPAQVRVRMLTADNALEAMRAPERFRRRPGRIRRATAGRLALSLPPFGVVRLDGLIEEH